MTVGELIEKLQKYDKHQKVILDINDNWDNHSRDIEAIYEDYLIDMHGISHNEKCVYLETEI
jgi:hypothetical protein|nr:MAG TPA: autophagy protein [Caudoviricetes sp.]